MIPVERLRRAALGAATVFLCGFAASAGAADAVIPELPTVTVQATAIAGNSIEIDKIPAHVESLYAADLSRTGPASLTGALDSRLGSVNVNDNLDDPFQPDIVYRGFEASPVLGTPQGLAVYQNGVRINEAFGDTVNWDLFPDVAINQVDVVSSNPVYGLNALGGAISVTMKNGFTHQGADVEGFGGSFGQSAGVLQFGTHSGHLGVYAAGKVLDQTGWRLFSNDSLRQFYGALSAQDDGASLDLSYTAADNHLNGQGSAPVQELAVSRGLVFTGPQANMDRLDFLTLNGSLKLLDGWSLQSVLYYREFRQEVANGNTTNYTGCTGSGFLCQADGLTPVTNAAGAVLPDISRGGLIPIGEIDFEAIHTYGRGAALQTGIDHALAGGENRFTAGATLDQARVHFHSGARVGVITPDLLVQPSTLLVDTPESSPFGATPVGLQARDEQYGFYATDTLDVTAALSMTASARYNVAIIDLEDELGTELTGDSRYTHFNPALGATYKLAPALTLYAGYSSNTRTPTASEIECSNPLRPCLLPSNLAGDPPTLRQVISQTAEAGARGRISQIAGPGSDLSWNFSAFRTQLHDDIYGIATSVSQGFFQNIGDTRRQGIEAGFNLNTATWSSYLSYSYVDATFESALTLPSPSNPFQNANGDIQVRPGNRLPGIPQHRIKAGADYRIIPPWTVGATLSFVGDQPYVGDASNKNAPLPGHTVVGLQTAYQMTPKIQLFAHIDNLLNARYSTFGILSDPTGVGAPGVPKDGVTNGAGVDNRFQSPAPPFAIFGGVRITF